MTTKPVSFSGGRMVYLTANLLCFGGTTASSLPLAARAGMPLAGVAHSWIRSGTGESSSPDVCSTKDEIVESGSTSLSLSFRKMRPGMYSFGRPTCSSGWVHHAPFSRSGTAQARVKRLSQICGENAACFVSSVGRASQVSQSVSHLGTEAHGCDSSGPRNLLSSQPALNDPSRQLPLDCSVHSILLQFTVYL